MNKKIVAFSILLLMMCSMAVSVFADNDERLQYEYIVTINMEKGSGAFKEKQTKDVPIWAYNQQEAREEALKACDWKYPGWTVTSCGYPVATGRNRKG